MLSMPNQTGRQQQKRVDILIEFLVLALVVVVVVVAVGDCNGEVDAQGVKWPNTELRPP